MLSPLVGLGATALAATGLLPSLIPEYLLQSTRTAAPPRNSSGELLSPAVYAFIRETMDLWELKVLSVAVVRKRADGSGLFDVAARGYGVAGRDGRPVTTETLFPIGSNSKAFAVAAVGHLVTNESINLDWTSKVHSVLPEFELKDEIATRDANLIDLFSHRTGLPRHDWAYRYDGTPPSGPTARDRAEVWFDRVRA